MATKADYGILSGLDQRGELELSRRPNLLIRGAKDWLVDEAAAYDTAAALSSAPAIERLAAWAGHYPMIERPRAVAELINDFLRGTK
jgi:pimeloyl-ACP methyl ester carboxylesterase